MKVTIPENISDITLKQYQRYQKLLDRDDLNQFNFNKRMVEIFCNVPKQKINNIATQDFDLLVTEINKAISQDCEFVDRFELNGVKYGFIPNFDKMTAKEFFDLSLHGVEIESLNKIMAILFRPVVKEDRFKNYTIEAYNGTDERADIMLDMPMNVVNGALVFFSSLAKELRISIQKSTDQLQVKVNKLQTTLVSGDGMQR